MQHLYIASLSPTRHELLRQARIPFTPIHHNADEQAFPWRGSVYDVALGIAHRKMEHAQLPDSFAGRMVYVLSADTVSIDHHGTIHGKPRDRQDAVAKIRQLRAGSTVSTGVCIRKMWYQQERWHVSDEKSMTVSADVVFDVPDAWIDIYLNQQPYALSATGAIVIDGYGSQFLKRISGSYTAVLGLPLYHVRWALECMGFYT